MFTGFGTAGRVNPPRKGRAGSGGQAMSNGARKRAGRLPALLMSRVVTAGVTGEIPRAGVAGVSYPGSLARESEMGRIVKKYSATVAGYFLND